MTPQFAKHTKPEIQYILESERMTLESAASHLRGTGRQIAASLAQNTRTSRRVGHPALRTAVAAHKRIIAILPRSSGGWRTRLMRLAKNMNFSFFYDAKKKALSIGFEVENNAWRRISIFAGPPKPAPRRLWPSPRAKFPRKAGFRWNAGIHGTKASEFFLSWTGTMFEYLMPMLWMKTFPNTLSMKLHKRRCCAQKKFAESKSVPWGSRKRPARS